MAFGGIRGPGTVGAGDLGRTHTPLPTSLSLTLDTDFGADVAALSVVTDTGTRRTPVTSPELAPGDVDPARYTVAVDVPAGLTRTLRLVVEAVRDRLPTVRVLDLGAGVLPRVEPWVRLPLTEPSPDLVGLEASTDDRSACYPLSSGVLACSPDRRRVGEEATTMRRRLVVASERSYAVSGTAVAAGTGADDLLRRLDGIRARGSSRWVPEPGVSPELVVDGDPKTYWAADPSDETPTLTVTWPTTRQVEGLRLEVDPDAAGTQTHRGRRDGRWSHVPPAPRPRWCRDVPGHRCARGGRHGDRGHGPGEPHRLRGPSDAGGRRRGGPAG